jgi:hypothetical protein
MSNIKSEYINECMKDLNIKSIEHNKELFDEYKEKLIQLQNKFLFKCNVETFSYCANNVIYKIFSYLSFFDGIPFGITNKRYLQLFTDFDHGIIELRNRFQNYFIETYPNKKFGFTFHHSYSKLKRDVIKYKDCHSLYLPNYRNIDISFLKNVKVLNLRNSYKIKNVDSLKYSTYLILSGCNGIKYFNALADGTIKYLDLSRTQINNIDKFVNIETLILRGCYNLPFIPYLPNLKHLDISYSYSIKDIDHRMIENLEYLNITSSRLKQETIDYFSKKFPDLKV